MRLLNIKATAQMCDWKIKHRSDDYSETLIISKETKYKWSFVAVYEYRSKMYFLDVAPKNSKQTFTNFCFENLEELEKHLIPLL